MRDHATKRGRRLRTATALLAGGALVGALASAAAASDDDDVKPYTVDIDGATVGAAPAAWSGDADATITITIKNLAKRQRLGSANVTVPAPYVLRASADDTVAGGPVLELRNLAIAAGTSRSFTITVEVQACTPVTPTAFAVQAKQSNDFNGTGNDFTLVSATTPIVANRPDRVVENTGSCALAWVAQPKDAQRNATITSVAFTPAGAPISVEVRDAGNSGRATSSAATVTLVALNAAVPAPVLGGTTSTAAVAGLATFTPGPTLGTSASGYQFRADSSGLTSATSTPFTIYDAVTKCATGASCSATTTTAGNTLTVNFAAGTDAPTLLASIGAAGGPTFECAGYPRTASTVVSQFQFADGDSTRLGTMTVTSPNPTNLSLSTFQVCWAATYPFTTKAGVPAVVQGTKPGTSLPLYVGLLPDCKKKRDDDDDRRSSSTIAPTPPCISARQSLGSGTTRTANITVTATGGDPWRY